MKSKILKMIVFLIIISLSLPGCSKNTMRIIEDKKEGKRLDVYASFYPYYDFAKKIGGESVDVHIIIPSGTEPHSFEPSAKVVAQLEEADVFIYNGAYMEPWIDKVLNLLEGKDIYLVEAGKSVELISYSGDPGDESSGEHHHGEYDPHIWVDPVNVIYISEKIKDTFISADNKNKDIYEENFNVFREELQNLDRAFKEGLKDAAERKIIVSHSAFGYLAKRYNLEQIAVAGISPHAEPSPKRLAELVKVARDNDMDHIFLEALASVKTAEILAEEANLEVLTLYIVEGLTTEQQNEGEDYISLMYKNVKTLKKALVK
ncbi:MAG TPA: zinc ABC transporter substrate-binding protein [Oscillospiraceae bacterium]|nr:zinc ABC transporter substrate-binding protein [Oscillospiraceae bacterium]